MGVSASPPRFAPLQSGVGLNFGERKQNKKFFYTDWKDSLSFLRDFFKLHKNLTEANNFVRFGNFRFINYFYFCAHIVFYLSGSNRVKSPLSHRSQFRSQFRKFFCILFFNFVQFVKGITENFSTF